MAMKDPLEEAQERYLAEFPDPQCLHCEHYQTADRCAAFPQGGIPMEYMSNRLPHQASHPRQKNALVFSPKPQAKDPSALTPGQKRRLPVVAHIPHSSARVPERYRAALLLNDQELRQELLALTDWYTDELFAGVAEQGGEALVFELSRFLVDPERFEDDAQEAMAARGMGVIYTKTTRLTALRRPPSQPEREELLSAYYRPHHQRLTQLTEDCLERFGRCLLLDCHSFPEFPLPYERNPDALRPQICIGTDSCHTPDWAVRAVEEVCDRHGLTSANNTPFAGTIVPLACYGRPEVFSLMLEINRSLYMDEKTGRKTAGFESTRAVINEIIAELLSSGGMLGNT